jgi:hypothetical protein
VVLELMLIGVAIALEPFPVTAFILILSAEQGTRKGLAFVLGWPWAWCSSCSPRGSDAGWAILARRRAGWPA